MAEAIRNRKGLHQNPGKSPLAARFPVSSLWLAEIQFYSYEKALPMFQMQTSGFGNSRHDLSCHKGTAGKMVLGNLLDGF